jgi:general nucleoside transport system permease protein
VSHVVDLDKPTSDDGGEPPERPVDPFDIEPSGGVPVSLARRFVLAIAAPLIAIVFSLAVSAVILAVSGNSPVDAYREMWTFGTSLESIVTTINRSLPLFLAGSAVAIGFKMGLFNIGVEGQYRVAVLTAAYVGAAVSLPAPIHVLLIVVVAMAVGAAWAGVVGVLKVTRGVNEVVASIMLNFIAVNLVAYLLTTWWQHDDDTLQISTKPLPRSAQFPSLNPILEWIDEHVPVLGWVRLTPRSGFELFGTLIPVILIGIGFWVLIWRTRFGFDLRATGMNPFAARFSGVDTPSMVLRAMLLSGAIAGLIGIPALLGDFHQFDFDFPQGLGFTGIAVALLGRNHPVGIALAALLFGWLDRSGQVLDLIGVPKEIVTIMQGIIVISVVIAYEVVARVARATEARAAATAARTTEAAA